MQCVSGPALHVGGQSGCGCRAARCRPHSMSCQSEGHVGREHAFLGAHAGRAANPASDMALPEAPTPTGRMRFSLGAYPRPARPLSHFCAPPRWLPRQLLAPVAPAPQRMPARPRARRRAHWPAHALASQQTALRPCPEPPRPRLRLALPRRPSPPLRRPRPAPKPVHGSPD